MILYELLKGNHYLSSRVAKEGRIWCTDGSFVDPCEFNPLRKIAYGYVLDKNRIVSLNKSSLRLSWAKSNNFMNKYLTDFRSSSLYLGSDNSEELKNSEEFSYANCPAIFYACNQINHGIESYMPAVKELQFLYNSIMDGRMKKDLITAGIYKNCNYRLRSEDGMSDEWHYIWSSTQHISYCKDAWYVGPDGSAHSNSKLHKCYVIPFFNI